MKFTSNYCIIKEKILGASRERETHTERERGTERERQRERTITKSPR